MISFNNAQAPALIRVGPLSIVSSGQHCPLFSIIVTRGENSCNMLRNKIIVHLGVKKQYYFPLLFSKLCLLHLRNSLETFFQTGIVSKTNKTGQ